MTATSRIALGRWALALAWAAFVLVLSSDAFADERTGSWLRGLLGIGGESPWEPLLQGVHFTARKAGHVAEYAVLAVLVARAFVASGTERARAALLAVLAAGAFALLDEGRQGLTRMREPALGDVAIDAAGAAGAALVWRRRAPRQ